MKRYFLTLIFAMSALVLSAQSLDRMQWFNEPESWNIKGGTLTMDVTPQSDYWRISHYGFTVDDAPFLYTVRGGEFDDKHYTMMRNCWMADNTPIMVGMMAACPDGKGFKAKFEHFSIKHLPDQRRLEWLKNNQ